MVAGLCIICAQPFLDIQQRHDIRVFPKVWVFVRLDMHDLSRRHRAPLRIQQLDLVLQRQPAWRWKVIMQVIQCKSAFVDLKLAERDAKPQALQRDGRGQDVLAVYKHKPVAQFVGDGRAHGCAGIFGFALETLQHTVDQFIHGHWRCDVAQFVAQNVCDSGWPL